MSASHVFEFDEESHTYTLDGLVIPSVTQLLKPIGTDFSEIPPMVLEAKRELGVAVHAATELDDLDELDDLETDPRVMGYVRAWRRFKADTGAEVLMTEQRLYSSALRFAGTLDGVVRVRSGEVYLVDRKTSVAMPWSYGVQLAGYQLLLDESAFSTRLERKGVRLSADGTYKLVPYNNPNDEPCFRALLAIYNWKESNR